MSQHIGAPPPDVGRGARRMQPAVRTAEDGPVIVLQLLPEFNAIEFETTLSVYQRVFFVS